jgi:nucleoid-associated protein YgaU
MTRAVHCVVASLALLALPACKSGKSGKRGGPPKKLPPISVNSSAAPPRHNLSRGEYPFDAQGNYVSAWAAEGERQAGRAAVHGTDYSTWRSSHSGGSRSSSSSSTARKTTSSSTAKKPASSSSGGSVYHTVKSGDTLSAIARRYSSSVAKIKAANGLKSDLIRPGQRLRVPR